MVKNQKKSRFNDFKINKKIYDLRVLPWVNELLVELRKQSDEDKIKTFLNKITDLNTKVESKKEENDAQFFESEGQCKVGYEQLRQKENMMIQAQKESERTYKKLCTLSGNKNDFSKLRKTMIKLNQESELEKRDMRIDESILRINDLAKNVDPVVNNIMGKTMHTSALYQKVEDVIEQSKPFK